VCFRLRARFRLSDRALVSPSSVGPPVWTAVAMQIGLGRIRGAAAQTRCQAMAREERPVKLGQAQSVAADTQRACLSTRPRATTTHARRCPAWPRRPAHSRTARNVPRTSTNARLGEALSGSQDLHAHAPLHTFRERPRTHAWPKPCLAGTTYTLMHRSQRSESDDEPTHGRSPVGRKGPTRSRTAPHVPRTTTKARMGEALFGGPTHDARTNAVLREEHLAWPPVWDGAS
jgi:hypothetical protein